MKIHSVELRQVRQIKELRLDLSAPLTIIAGPNGVGKTTLQQAILAAMFIADKETRDSFISQFDKDSPPTVVLHLSRGGPAPTIVLTRTLLDDKGEWQEGASILKKKKEALDKVQEVLPLKADAAALLLWGRQDDLALVVESFPADGHTLLSAATIKGAGPDPKEIVKELDRDREHVRKGERGGQVIGDLIRARKEVAKLEQELALAASADEELRSRRGRLDQAKRDRDQIKEQARAAQTQIDKLEQLEKLLIPALKDLDTRDQMAETLSVWGGLDEEIGAARKDLAELQREAEQLGAQHRVAHDRELGGRIEDLTSRIAHAEAFESACATLTNDLEAKRRPEPGDVQQYHTLHSQLANARAKMEATGVRYELAAEDGPRTLRLAEDGQPEAEITLEAGAVHRGIVGRVTVVADGLRFTAAGKEDLSGLKQIERQSAQELTKLFDRFGVADEAGFLAGARAQAELRQALTAKKNELKVHLGAAAVAGLKTDLQRLEAARTDNRMTLQDQEACAGKQLASAAEIGGWHRHKQGEILKAKDNMAALEQKRPSDAEKNLHQKNLEAVRKRARESAAAFTDVDDQRREPTKELQTALRASLERQRREQEGMTRGRVEAESKVAGLIGKLEETDPHRALDTIGADLEEARQTLQHEETQQQARTLLIERIEATAAALGAHVPVELGERVTRQLARLTAGSGGRVVLGRDLTVAHVGENGSAVQHWQPRQLSHGERHQAALAVKIAVARALAETSGPVFIILDDSLVAFDPRIRRATEEFLLDLVADGKLQVILLTCHSDWAADWKMRCPERVQCIELASAATYYRVPPALAADGV